MLRLQTQGTGMTNSPPEHSNVKRPTDDTDADKTPATSDQEPKVESGKTPEMAPKTAPQTAAEIGGPKGPEPTRFGDWEQKGRCSDF